MSYLSTASDGGWWHLQGQSIHSVPGCSMAVESWGADQLASFGMPWLWQILPTAQQQNQDEKGMCDFLKAKVWRNKEILKDTWNTRYKPGVVRGMSVSLELIGAVLWPSGFRGWWAWLGTASHTPAMHRKGWHPSRAMDMLGQAGSPSPDFPCAVSNI